MTKIGRGAEKRLGAQAESWDKLNGVWMKGGEGIRDSGLSVKDRRYVAHGNSGEDRCTAIRHGRCLFGNAGEDKGRVADFQRQLRLGS